MLMTKPASSPATPVRDKSPDSITMTASPGSSMRSAISISDTPGNDRSGTGGGSRLTMRASLPSARSAYAMATCDPIASPSGRTWDAITKRRRLRISSAARWSVSDSVAVVVMVATSLAFLFVQVAQNLFDPILVGYGFVEPELELGHASQA